VRVTSFLSPIPFAILSSLALAQQAPQTEKGYTGAYSPPGPEKPYSTGPLPQIDAGSGRDVPGPNDTTKTVKAVPCSTAARETDGSTTCIGIPDSKKDK
jgi:hypothetical protein